MHKDLDPRDLIDRQAEQELFRGIVPGPMTGRSPPSSARMLTICDKGGRGKSCLLKRLLYNCRYEIRASGSLVELDRLEDPSPFTFVKRIYDGLTTVPGEVDIRDRFARFKKLDEARELKDLAIFEKDEDRRVRGSRIFASAHASSATEGARLSGVNFEHVERAEFNQVIERRFTEQFTEEQEQRARDKCVEAFFEDLRAVCATQAVALMLDGWERCNLQLRDWIRDIFLGDRCLHPDRNLRPEKFSVVVAGRPYDPPQSMHGLRPDEFRPLFDTAEEFEATVLSVRSLSEWEKEHVRTFLEFNGCSQPDDDEINFIQSRLKLGWSLEKILTLIDEHLRS